MAKLGEDLKFKYEPIWEQSPVDMKFHYYDEDGALKIHEENFKLITSLNELEQYAELCKDKMISFDTETTGLTYGDDKIVGFSISLDRWSGFYVPIRHKNTVEVKEEVEKLDKDGNPIILKSGKKAKKTVTSYIYKENESNLDPKKALDILYEILTGAKKVLMHNSEFDLNMLKFEGYNVLKIKAFDTLILPYLFDPEATKLAGLKALEKLVLGRTVPEFKDVLGTKAKNFSCVNPEDGYVYACCDTAGTYGVYEVMLPEVKKLLNNSPSKLAFDGEPYNVLVKDNQIVKTFVDYYGHAKILIDREKAIKYRENLEEEQRKVIEEIYNFFNAGNFNLSASSKQFKEVMGSKEVYTRIKTDKGGDSWSKKATAEMKKNIAKLKEGVKNRSKYEFADGVLSKEGVGFQFANILYLYGQSHFKMKDEINNLKVKGLNSEKIDNNLFWLTCVEIVKQEEQKIHILELIQKNNSLNKALNSYVDKLTQVDECYMKYKLKGTKSGRLSSGNGSKSDKRKNHYYIDLNAQNLTKPASGYYKAERCSEDDEESILGWKFTPLNKDYAMEHLEDLYIVEGQDPGITIRGCLRAPSGEVKFGYTPSAEGTEDKEIFEVEMEDGRSIKCCKDTVFKVKSKGKILFMTLEDITKLDDAEILED